MTRRTLKPFACTVGRTVASFGAALLMIPLLSGQTSTKAIAVIPSEAVIVRKKVIEPAKITRPAGAFVLYLENRTGSTNETYRLDPEPVSGASQGAPAAPVAKLGTQGLKWWDHAVVNLPPGSYRLSLGSRPDLTLQLIITK